MNGSCWVWNVLLLVVFLHFTDSTVCVFEQSETERSGEEYMRVASSEIMWRV